ncbi:MAG: heavy metal translocating P-type ATPase [Thiolinea sp.]
MNTHVIPAPVVQSESSKAAVSCYHCGLDVPKYSNHHLVIDGESQPMCCLGCLAAAEFIQQHGMGEFYQYRGDQLPQGAVSGQFTDHSSWQYYDQPEVQQLYQQDAGQHDEQNVCTRIYVQGMYCNSCSWLIDSALSQLPGVEQIQLNPATHQVQLNWQPEQSRLSEILGTIARLGYQPRPLQASETSVDQREAENRQSLKRLAVAGFGMMQVMTYAIGVYWGDYQGIDAGMRQFLHLISMLVATVVVFYAGQPFFKHAYYDLKNRHLGMDVPVALAIGGAYAASVWQLLIGQQETAGVYFDSAVMFVFFLSLGRFVEMRARYSAASSADALRQLLPPLVQVWREGESQILAPEQVQRGDEVDVLTGDIVPCDGRVLSGEAWLDESLLTGEAQAVARAVDQHVTSGTQLTSGSLRIVATRDWEQSTIASIRQLLGRAQAYRPQRIRLADQLSRYFVAVLLVLTLVVAGVWYFFIAPEEVFRIVLAMLIASCPCAFSLATPAVLTVASHFLSRKGVLLSNADACETLLEVDHWCFDKTGTLSTAELTIRQVDTLTALPEQECLNIIAGIEQHSDHVLASAFPVADSHCVTQVEVAHGRGISAMVNGEQYFVGSMSWVAEQCAVTQYPAMERQHSLVVLGKPGVLLAVVYLSDKLRADSAKTLQYLGKQGKRISLLSGDRTAVVKHFAQDLALDHCQGNLLPEDKMLYLRRLQEQGQCVAMVGDGVNDAPVLGQADVSIAMASGSQLSQSHADIILLGGRLQGLITALQVSARARQIIRQNLGWALAYNLVVLPLAALGMLEPWMAAIGMSLSSLLVVLNARRLNNLRLP